MNFGMHRPSCYHLLGGRLERGLDCWGPPGLAHGHHRRLWLAGSSCSARPTGFRASGRQLAIWECHPLALGPSSPHPTRNNRLADSRCCCRFRVHGGREPALMIINGGEGAWKGPCSPWGHLRLHLCGRPHWWVALHGDHPRARDTRGGPS